MPATCGLQATAGVSETAAAEVPAIRPATVPRASGLSSSRVLPARERVLAIDVPAATRRVAPLAIVTPPVPRAALLAALSVPALIVVPPV